ncbi:MAG: hypothetical protein ACK5ZS_00865, partial [bacterium]
TWSFSSRTFAQCAAAWVASSFLTSSGSRLPSRHRTSVATCCRRVVGGGRTFGTYASQQVNPD